MFVGGGGCFFKEDDSRRAVINRVRSPTTNCSDALIGQSVNHVNGSISHMSASGSMLRVFSRVVHPFPGGSVCENENVP